jgi:hypothetical protein
MSPKAEGAPSGRCISRQPRRTFKILRHFGPRKGHLSSFFCPRRVRTGASTARRPPRFKVLDCSRCTNLISICLCLRSPLLTTLPPPVTPKRIQPPPGLSPSPVLLSPRSETWKGRATTVVAGKRDAMALRCQITSVRTACRTGRFAPTC